MKPKQMMMFAVAIGCGLVAMIGAQQILSGNKPVEKEVVKILVAKVDIAPGVLLDESNVMFKEWPKDNVLEGAILNKEDFAEHASKIRISAHMPVLAQYLGPKGVDGISSMIPKGMELVTITVDSTMTHGGLLRPNSYVNVTCAISRPGRDNQQKMYRITPVLKRVKVLCVGDRYEGAEPPSKDVQNAGKVETISLITHPMQAKLLNLAKVVSEGKMYIALLGEEDKSIVDEDLDEAAFAQRSRDLLGEKGDESPDDPLNLGKGAADANVKPQGSSFLEYLKQQPVAPEVAELGKQAAKATWRIEVHSGDKKSVKEFDIPDEEKPVTGQAAELPATASPWSGPLMRFFSRKRAKTEIQETQSTPVEEENSQPASEKNAATDGNSIRR